MSIKIYVKYVKNNRDFHTTKLNLPTGNLDPVTAREIMELLSEINKKGTTVLVVTHNRELVNEMGKRVIQIEDGQIQQDEARGFYDI